MSERDELALLLANAQRKRWNSHPLTNVNQVSAGALDDADAVLTAGYRKPSTITTAEELDALPYGTVVLHDEGWNVTVAQRQAEDMRWYVTGCLEYIRPEALLPATVVHAPEYFS